MPSKLSFELIIISMELSMPNSILLCLPAGPWEDPQFVSFTPSSARWRGTRFIFKI